MALTLFTSTLTSCDAHYDPAKGLWERILLGQVLEDLHEHHNELWYPSWLVLLGGSHGLV